MQRASEHESEPHRRKCQNGSNLENISVDCSYRDATARPWHRGHPRVRCSGESIADRCLLHGRAQVSVPYREGEVTRALEWFMRAHGHRSRIRAFEPGFGAGEAVWCGPARNACTPLIRASTQARRTPCLAPPEPTRKTSLFKRSKARFSKFSALRKNLSKCGFPYSAFSKIRMTLGIYLTSIRRQ